MLPWAQSTFSQAPNGAPQYTDNPQQQLQELELEILRVESLLAELTRRRVPLKRSINHHHSPMLSLPVELCSEIFTTCFPPTPEVWGKQTPLVLGQVCTAWRTLAWSMPWLWNTVVLKSDSPSLIHVELLNEWIARSAYLPLSIYFKLKNPEDEIRPSVIYLMDVAAHYSKRWHTIDFDVPFFFPANPTLCNVTPTNLPLLTSASVQVQCDTGTQLDVFLAAPQLYDVQLKNFPRNSISLPIHQITRLRLSPTTVQQCLEILSRFPNLTHCTFEDIRRSDVVNPVAVPAHRLESLEVISFTHTPLSELLDALLIPAARELSFHVTGNSFPHWSFISLIVRSSCTLERLALNAVRITEWQLWECLQTIPSLLSLKLTNLERITIDTIRALNPQNHTALVGSAQYLLPFLEEFVYMGTLQINFLVVANMLQSRWTMCETPGEVNEITHLRSFDFTTSAPTVVNEDDKAYLRTIHELVQEGMNVSLVTCDGKWI